MKKALLTLFIVSAVCLTAVGFASPGAAPQPTSYMEFYWDDGPPAESFWYWTYDGYAVGVEFNEEKTGGNAGYVNKMGVVTYPGIPGNDYYGFNMHIYDDDGGRPGVSIFDIYLPIAGTGAYEWVDGFVQYIFSPVFYIVARQIGDSPDCDSIGFDSGQSAGNPNWWTHLDPNEWAKVSGPDRGDWMIRCYWSETGGSSVSQSTWGAVKNLYQ